MFGTKALILAASINAGLTFKPSTFKQAEKRYGKLYLDYSWGQKNKWLTRLDWTAWGLDLKHGYINKDMMLPMVMVLIELKQRGMIDEIKEFKGCYSPRSVRKSKLGKPSVHAYGLGCDFNNGPFTAEFVEVWKRWGFCWGGDFDTPDPMHFSYAWECRDRRTNKSSNKSG